MRIQPFRKYLMSRQMVMTIVLILGIISAAQADDARAIRALENAGAIITRDDSQPDHPVETISLNLREVTSETNQELKEIEELPSIDILGSGDTEISVATLQSLQRKKSLKRFAIAYAKISDESAKILGTLKSLETLELRAQNELSPKGIQEIFHLTNVRQLTLSDRLVSDEILENLVKFPHLKVLNIHSVFVTNEGITSLRRLRNLRTLRLYLGPQVSENGMRQLAEFNLSALEITYLDVNDEKIKDLRKLAGLKSLRLINASKVSDDAVPYLAELTELKKLDIADANLTKAGIDQLKRSLPRTEVVSMTKRRS
jgi:hypothetical protein